MFMERRLCFNDVFMERTLWEDCLDGMFMERRLCFDDMFVKRTLRLDDMFM